MLRIPQISKRIFKELFSKHYPPKDSYFVPKEGQVNFKFENDDYSVTVNDEFCPVRSCRVSAIPFNRTWPGKQRDISQTENASFITFSSDEPVKISIKTNLTPENPIIRPLAENISFSQNEDAFSFELTHPGSYVFEPCGEHKVLHIFFNPIKDYPDAESAAHYFGPGLHFPGTIYLHDNDSVYIHEEAIVFGSLYTEGAENVRVFGGGILDNTNEERIVEHCYENFTKGTVRIYNSKNISFEDIILMNSCTWILSMFYCENINIDNVKLIGHWRYNTDGIDIVNSSNVTIKNSFIRSFDDTITIKGIYNYPDTIENITVDNCVLWCGWGHTCEIGIETRAEAIKNIVFKNSHCIHVSGPALAIPNECYADISSVNYENIYIEFQDYTLAQVYQQTDNMNFEERKRPARHIAVSLINRAQDNPTGEKRTVGKNCIHDIYFKNIHVLNDKPETRSIIRVYSKNDDVIFKNIHFENLYLNGEQQHDFSSFDTEFINAENITIK